MLDFKETESEGVSWIYLTVGSCGELLRYDNDLWVP
jgi:hypothetical protein